MYPLKKKKKSVIQLNYKTLGFSKKKLININHIIPNFLSCIISITIHFNSHSKFQIYLPPLHFLYNLYFTFVGTALCPAVLWVVTCDTSCVSQIERDREREFLVKKLLQLLLFSSEMEKALTKVGSFWISKKAKAEISNITEDLSVCFTWILHIFY